MKKINLGIALSLMGIAIIMGSCENELANISENSSNNQVAETESLELETNYGKFIESKIKLFDKTLDILESYGYGTSTISRSVANVSAEDYFDEIGKKLPKDLSSVTKKVSSNSRNATENSSETEITLQDELNEIASEYIQSLKDNLPDLTPLNNLDGIQIIDDSLYLENGMIVQINSPEGIALTEYLLAFIETGDKDLALEKIENDLSTLLSAYSDYEESRGVYFTNTGGILGYGARWNNGIIYYRWGDIYDSHKEALLKAMEDWEEKVNTKSKTYIKFEELEDTAWNNFCCVIGAKHVCTYKTGKLDENINGQTSALGQQNFMTLTLSDTLSGDSLYRTPRHELGHVFGMIHEHQRADRDNYIEVNKVDVTWEKFLSNMNTNFNLGTFPEYLGGLVWKTKTIKRGWFVLNINYLTWDSKKTQITSLIGDFDFESIMLYFGFKIKDSSNYKYGRFLKGAWKTYPTAGITLTDIETVRNMYK